MQEERFIDILVFRWGVGFWIFMVYFYCFYLCVWGAGERVHASAGVCGGQRCLILLEPELKTLVVCPLWCGCLQQNSGPGQAHMLPATEPSLQPKEIAQTDL